MLPRLFIGSSVESLKIANAVHEVLERDADVTVWNQDVFRPSSMTLPALLEAVGQTDFALFILAPDDITTLRGREVKTARDNIILELGLFVGRLGLKRTFFMMPLDADLHLPTDMLGITPLSYNAARQDLVPAVATACNKIRRELASAATSTAPGRSGFVTILSDIDEGSRFAADRVKEARVVRVVGTARQDVVGTAGTAAADAYLKATETRFASGQPLVYMRITSPRLTARFKQHLIQLFDFSRSTTAVKFEVAISELDPAVSYMVFDENGVLLVVDNTILGPVRDNQLMLWSAEPDVVRAFKNHFDQAWSTLPDKIRSKAALERAVTLRK
jgi:hypothetical protein